MAMKASLSILAIVCLMLYSKAGSAEVLQCYVCTDCAQINNDTPIMACNADSFTTTVSTTLLTTVSTEATTNQTTIKDTSTTPTTTEKESSTSTSTTPSTTTTTALNTTTNAPITTTSTASTAPTTPTPATAGPPQNATTIPTPPTLGPDFKPVDIDGFFKNNSASVVDSAIEAGIKTTTVDGIETTTIVNERNDTSVGNGTQALDADITKLVRSSRVVRAVGSESYSYHCFVVKRNVNGSKVTDRGCTRVSTDEAVCPKLEELYEHTVNKCTPCSMSKCNGSAAFTISLFVLMVGVSVAFLNSQ